MNLHDNLCNAFCGALRVSKVPAGFAVSTGYTALDGDNIGFYVVGPDADGKYRVQDDGMYMVYVEAEGGDLASKTRVSAFNNMREEYSVEYDEDSGELTTKAVPESQVASSALKFLAFLLRVQDLILMSTERALSTFKEDALRMLQDVIGDRAQIKQGFVVSPDFQEIPADVGIIAEGRPPVALFFGVSDARILEALLLQAYVEKAGVPCSVMAMLENDGSIGAKMRQRVSNHLDGAPIYRGAERDACEKIAKAAIGPAPTKH